MKKGEVIMQNEIAEINANMDDLAKRITSASKSIVSGKVKQESMNLMDLEYKSRLVQAQLIRRYMPTMNAEQRARAERTLVQIER